MAQHNIQYSDFTDLRAIGSGTFGSVRRADYLGTDVAIKECFRQLPDAPDFDFEKYFNREVDMLKQATHPNIVQFMGTCEHNGSIFIVTEYTPNGNLKQVSGFIRC